MPHVVTALLLYSSRTINLQPLIISSYYMYNIIQLNDKELSDLQAIAKELGIKKVESLKKEELVYKILDEQAIVGANKKVATDKQKEEKKKRSKATNKKENKATPNSKSNNAANQTPNDNGTDAAGAEKENKSVGTDATTTKRKGRPRKNENKSNAANTTSQEGTENETQVQDKEGKRNLDPRSAANALPAPVIKEALPEAKNEKEKNVETGKETNTSPAKTPVVDSERELLTEMDDNEDFIPIENLPSEKKELPSELIGKFEATKIENSPAIQPSQNQQQGQQGHQRQRPQRQRENNKAEGRICRKYKLGATKKLGPDFSETHKSSGNPTGRCLPLRRLSTGNGP